MILFENLRNLGYNLSEFEFASCLSCVDGISLSTRTVLPSKYCNSVSQQLTKKCGFACNNLTIFNSVSESMYILKQELEKYNFINQIFNKIFNVSVIISVSQKRSGSWIGNQKQ